jgi:hypothetical protein
MLLTMDKFISESHNKTPPMKVTVIDQRGHVVFKYEAPAGFQLERYVSSLYPNNDIMVSSTHFEICVSVCDGKEVIEIHRGLYKNLDYH